MDTRTRTARRTLDALALHDARASLPRQIQNHGPHLAGAFQAFIIEQDHHLLTVLRYVERSALRANLVSRAEHWRWGSLNWRACKDPPVPLDPPPFLLPANWVEYANEPQSAAELEAIRTCVNRQRPFGSHGWVERKARELGLVQSLASVGRPRSGVDRAIRPRK